MELLRTTIFTVICVYVHSDVVDRKPCGPNMVMNEKTGSCVRSTTSAASTVDRLGKACEIGLDQCPKLEDCVGIKNNRSRMGACRCRDGYFRNSTSGGCEMNVSMTSQTTLSPVADNVEVNVVGPANVTLPSSDANLTAVVQLGLKRLMPPEVKYSWSVQRSPSNVPDKKSPVVLEGRENETVHLHALQVGDYEFAVRTTYKDKTTVASWNLTVLPEAKENKAPVAVVQPPSEEVKENAQIILDGSSSKDEDGTIKDYVWTQVDGPVINAAMDGVLSRTPTLTLSSLRPGNYTFKLTVTDNGGMQASALSRVSVTAEVDYPPKAIAGSCEGGTLGDVAVRLPVEALYLCGNMSTDDKAIVKWKWTLKDTSKNTADMQGTGSSVLKIMNLHVGDYTFNLIVEDGKGQTSSADVHVVVMPERNKPPVAKAGQNQTVNYPESSAILDGSLSSDDKKISSYSWSQLEGPSAAVLANGNRAIMTVTGLQQGVYVFELNVTDDDGLSSTDRVFVTVDTSNNRPPVAVAPDLKVSLPCNLAILDASGSTDDAGVVRWLWSQHDSSPAGLELLGETLLQPQLHVSGLSHGLYVFNLTVFDKQGASGSKLVKMDVVKGDKETETVEIYLKTRISEFTLRHQRKLHTQLKAMLETNPSWDRVDVNITKVAEDPNDGSVRVLFYAAAGGYSENGDKLLRASVVAGFLETHAARSEFLTDFAITRIDSLYCQNNCSGRGRCEEFSKRCVCDRFWMPNLFLYFYRGKAKDCDWSILYFILVVVVGVVALVAAVWFSVRAGSKYCWMFCDSAKQGVLERRKRRYRLLRNRESLKGKSFGLKPLKGRNGHPPVASDSDVSSEEEETVYDRSSLLRKHRRDHDEHQRRLQDHDQHQRIDSNGVVVT